MAVDESAYTMVVPSLGGYGSVGLQARLLQQALQAELGIAGTIVDRADAGRSDLLPSSRPLIYHYDSYHPLASTVARLPSATFVFHNVTPAHFFWRWRPQTGLRALAAQFQLRSMPKDLRWVAVSPHNALTLQRLGFTNVRVCPVIVPTSFTPVPVGRVPTALVFLGRLVPNKNSVELTRHVLRAGREIGQKLKLLLIGDYQHAGLYAAAMRREFRRASASRWVDVEQIGGVDDRALVEHYSRAGLYVSMSLHEGFGLPPCEAVACGCPALYMECGGTESILDGHGMVSLRERGSFWRHLVHALSSDSWRDELLVAQRQLVRRYQMPHVGHAVREAYGFLADGQQWRCAGSR